MKTKKVQLISGNSIKFFLEGDEYYKYFIFLIENAQQSIHLQTYIFEMDTFGLQVYEALRRAALRNVKVYVLIDGFGSRNFSTPDKYSSNDFGIRIKRFNCLSANWFSQWGRRLHHKVLIIDEAHAIVGGINVISSYLSGKSKAPNLDFAVKITGPAIIQLIQHCQLTFQNVEKAELSKNIIPNKERQITFSNKGISISINDWVYQKWQIAQRYEEMIKFSEKEILIVCSYFFPRKVIINQLIEAKKRGVSVKLVLPMLSDWPIYVLATQYLYSRILSHGIKIYQWNKSILHGKLIVVDRQWMSVGSFNLNYTSYKQNIEINVDTFSKEFCLEISESINHIIDECAEVRHVEYLKSTTFSLFFLRVFSFSFLNIISFLSVGLIFQEDRNSYRIYKILFVLISVLCILVGLVGIFFIEAPTSMFFLFGFLMIYRQIYYNNGK